MSYPSSSAEVAEDFKEALQDLTTPDKAMINNLMIIAKENTEQAQGISRELVNHIKTTRPEHKLPALYVLDAIVKFVGTPYTVYLGRDLFNTFMGAYTLMSGDMRRSMENLFATWKQPPPDSLDPRPVFPVDTTKGIENALIKIRTVTLQQHQQHTQGRSMQHPLPARPGANMGNEPWRNTPTPPQNVARNALQHDPRSRQMTPQQPGTIAAASPYSSAPPGYGRPVNPEQPVDPVQLIAEVDKLISTARADFVITPHNQDIQKKLKALLDLRSILGSHQLPPEQLKLIKAQIMQLAPSALTPSNPVQPQSLSQMLQRPGSAAPPTPTPPMPQNQPPPSLSQLLQPRPPSTTGAAPFNLAQFLQNATSQSSTPLNQTQGQNLVQNANLSSLPVVPSPPPPAANTTSGLSLAQMLQQFAPPPPSSTTPSVPTLLPFAPPVPPPTASSLSNNTPNWLLEALKSQTLPGSSTSRTPIASAPPAFNNMRPNGSGSTLATPAYPVNDVELSTASITKKSRLHLIPRLYGALPNQCSTCGRRFPNSEDGKSMKAKHMDWHFKTKDPDIAKRGVHRSWYISEREWIDYREVDESSPSNQQNGASSGGVAASAKKDSAERYIRVPSELALQNAPCPICQERFEKKWMVEANDFVWMDAVKIGGKVYHASCWEEVNKGLDGLLLAQPARKSTTPDSVLGKRKAEADDFEPAKTKIR